MQGGETSRAHRMSHHENRRLTSTQMTKKQIWNQTSLGNILFTKPALTRIWMRSAHTLHAPKVSICAKRPSKLPCRSYDYKVLFRASMKKGLMKRGIMSCLFYAAFVKLYRYSLFSQSTSLKRCPRQVAKKCRA
jgi:hypothetical protein